jgi:enediyne biosynthesis protein E4
LLPAFNSIGRSVLGKQIIKFIILFICILQCINSTFGQNNPPYINEKTLEVDLFPQTGWQGKLIYPPAETENVISYHFLNDNFGYAIFDSKEKRYLYKYENGYWDRINITFDNQISKLAVNSPTNVWLTCDSDVPYKMDLLFFDGEKIKRVNTPNTDGINTIDFVSKDLGFAGCMWGQVLKFNGEEWELVYCPLNYHIEFLFIHSSQLVYALSDDPEKGLMVYDGFQFKTEISDSSTHGRFMAYMANSSTTEMPGYLKQFYSHELEKMIKRDTLFIEMEGFRAEYLMVSNNYETKAIDFSRIIFIDKNNKSNMINSVLISNWNDYKDGRSYILFSNYAPVCKFYLKYLEKKTIKNAKTPFKSLIQLDTSREHGICIFDFSGDGIEDVYRVECGDGNHFDVSYTLNEDSPNRSVYWIDSALDAGVMGPIRLNNTKPNYDSGVTCADIDNDGDQDIFVTSLTGENILFKQVENLKFKEFSRKLNIKSNSNRSQSGIWGDVNNDGYIDLLISNSLNQNELYLNNGSGYFIDISKEAGLSNFKGGKGSCFGDIDNDGDLDLFIPRPKNGNKLFRNDTGQIGNGAPIFTDITKICGIVWSDSISSTECGLFDDMDNDGDLDLFLAVSTGSNTLYENDGTGHFTNITEQAGLSDHFLSQLAVTLDADNDGDLDIFVANRGRNNRYYLNLGNNQFTEINNESYSHEGGYPTGLATGDLDGDGDVDIYFGDEKLPSIVFRNQINNSNYIRLFVKGSKSNRDAIGAKVYYYEHGHLGEENKLLGMRHVKAGDGKNSMSSRIVHFGVPDEGPKDIRVKFPSGIIKNFTDVTPGQILTIYEEQGLDRKWSLFKKWFVRTTRYPSNHNEGLFLLGFICFIFAANYTVKKVGVFYKKDRMKQILLPMVVFILMYVYLRNQSLFIQYGLPVLFGMSAWSIGYLSLQKKLTKQDAKEYEEKLFFSTNAFFHGEWGASRINQLLLYCKNLGDAQNSNIIVENLNRYIAKYFELVLPEIEKILKYAKIAGLDQSDNHAISTFNKKLMEQLLDLKTNLSLNNKIKNSLLKAVIESASMLLFHLRQIRMAVLANFSCEVVRIAEDLVKLLETGDYTFKLAIESKKDSMAIIRPSEFSQILQNLSRNAIRAVENRQIKEITIKIKETLDYIFVKIVDTGKGIDTDLKEKIFKEQISSKVNGGGFGLYYSQKLLVKYGGKLKIIKSVKGQGTEIELQLKRV